MTGEIQVAAAKVRAIVNGSDADVADAIVTLDGLAARIKELQADAKAAMLERIRESGPFRIGEYEYRLAKPRKVKCRDVAEATKVLLEATGGDLDKLNSCLAAGAWKHGQVARVLSECGAAGETWDNLFEVSYGEELEVEKVNLAFVK